MHKIFSCWGTDFSDLVLRRCLELQPNLGNLLLELKDLGLVARTDYEELLTNLSRMEVLLYTFSTILTNTRWSAGHHWVTFTSPTPTVPPHELL